MPQTDHDRERKFQIQLRMQIPDSCSEDTLHKSLKKKLVSSFSNAPLFQVNIQGLGTQMWILNAKLDNGALSTTSALRKKFRSPVQQAFEECLSPPDYASFIASFCKQGNNNRDFLKITADSDGPFPGPSHFWTDDGAVLPEFTSAIVDALFPEHGAASGGAGPASSSMASTVCGVKIHLRLPIPEGCNQIDIYNDLKRDVQELYAGATWFQVNFQGLGTQLWSMAARLNIGSNMLLRNYRTKFRKPILQSFKSHLAPMQYQIFETRFNKDKRLLQIEEDNAPFSGANHHSWTLDGIPESGDVDMDAAGRGRLSMPAPHPLGFPAVDASRLFDSMDATMAGWSVPAGSGPPAAAGGAAAA